MSQTGKLMRGLAFAAIIALSLVASAGDVFAATTDASDSSALVARGPKVCPAGVTWEGLGKCRTGSGATWE